MRRKCDMPFKMLKVQMDGQIFMCSNGQPAMINAFEVNPEDIWNSPRFLELRYQLDTEKYDAMCRVCPLVQDFGEATPPDKPLLESVKTLRLLDGNVVDSNGDPVEAGNSVEGFIDMANIADGRLVLQGWACAESKPAGNVLVFVNGAVFAATSPDIERPDVAQHFGSSQATLCGFILDIPLPSSETPVRVFATDLRGRIKELRYPDGFPFRLI